MSRLHGSKYTVLRDRHQRRRQRSASSWVRCTRTIKVRTDSLNAYNQNIYGPTTYPYAGAPGSVPLIATPCCITFGSIFDDKKRDALSGSLEWRPSDAFRLTADATLDPSQRPAGRLQRVVLLRGQPRRHAVAEQRGGHERHHHLGVGEQLPAGDGEQHPEPQGGHLPLWPERQLEADRAPQLRRRPVPLDREPPGGRPGHVRDRGPGQQLAGGGRHPELRRPAAQPAVHQRRRPTQPARAVGLPGRRGQPDQCRATAPTRH